MNEMSNGIDDREVIPYQEPKSIGREITFSKDIDNLETLKSVLLFLSQKLSLNLHSKKYMGRILTIKIRYSDFKTFTKRITLKNYTSAIFDIYKSSLNLLKEIDLLRKKVRLLGLSVGGLKSSSMLKDSLFNEEYKGEKLTDAIEKISDKYGETKLTIAGIKGKKPHK